MKKIILLYGMISILLVGCNKQDVMVNEYPNKSTNRFTETGNVYYISGNNWKEIVDTSTGNLYIMRNGSQSNNGICPLYNKNGEIANIDDN